MQGQSQIERILKPMFGGAFASLMLTASLVAAQVGDPDHPIITGSVYVSSTVQVRGDEVAAVLLENPCPVDATVTVRTQRIPLSGHEEYGTQSSWSTDALLAAGKFTEAALEMPWAAETDGAKYAHFELETDPALCAAMKIRPLHDRVLIKRMEDEEAGEAEETRLVMNLAQFVPAAHVQQGRVVVDSELNPATRDRSTYSGIYYVAKTTHVMAVLFSGCETPVGVDIIATSLDDGISTTMPLTLPPGGQAVPLEVGQSRWYKFKVEPNSSMVCPGSARINGSIVMLDQNGTAWIIPILPQLEQN
jgi:hypothetical protein